jgi:hypothetical protein
VNNGLEAPRGPRLIQDNAKDSRNALYERNCEPKRITMTNRPQEILDVRETGPDISEQTPRGRDHSCAEHRSQEVVPQDCRQMWKELFLEALFFKAILESDKEKLAELLKDAERVMVLRAEELLNSSNHHKERGEMDTALAALLSIKTHKLGWPAVSARDGLR